MESILKNFCQALYGGPGHAAQENFEKIMFRIG